MSPREVDVHTLPAMLTALRLPSFQAHWQVIAARADTESWQAARFLAVLADYELAERETRRIQRHLAASQLPGGKTLATFQFAVLPSISRARIEALAAGSTPEPRISCRSSRPRGATSPSRAPSPSSTSSTS
jgi:DNA replication protein DnaC